MLLQCPAVKLSKDRADPTMARRRRALSDPEIVAALDIGRSKVACVIAAPPAVPASADEGTALRVVGVGQYGAGSLSTNDEVEQAIRAAVEAAERMAGTRLQSVYVSARGRSVSCQLIGVDLEMAGGCVTADDVVDSISAGTEAISARSGMPLHTMPARYKLDRDVVADPIGMIGQTLTTEVIGLSAKPHYVANMEALLGRCALSLRGAIAAPLAVAQAVLLPDEKDLGAIVIDMGARTTDYAVYDRGHLIHCGAIALGGDHITRDVAQVFSAPIAAAERIKTLYGSAVSSAGDENRLVDVPQLGAPGEVARYSRSEIAAVIHSRLEEIYKLTLEAVVRSGRGERALKRAVLTGGGSLLVGAREVAEDVFKVKARLGRPRLVPGAPEAASAPQYSVCIGMIERDVINSCLNQRSSSRRRRAVSGPLHGVSVKGSEQNGIVRVLRSPRIVRQVGSWLKANF